MAFPCRERKCRCIVEYRQARVEDSGRTDGQTDIETDRQTDRQTWKTFRALSKLARAVDGQTDRNRRTGGQMTDGHGGLWEH